MESQKAILSKSLWLRSWSFSRELWNDHEFWIRALAVKGGASAIVVAGVVGISYVVALPFFVAALGIALCGGLISLGLYGVLLGTTSAWEKLRDAYYKTFFGIPPKEKAAPAKPLHQQLVEHPRFQKWKQSKAMQKILGSRAWKFTTAVTQKQQDLFLTGLAGTGSIFWGVFSAVTLITQIVVLPVVAIGSLLTFGTVLAVGGLLSGAYGVYLSIDSLLRSLGIKKNITMGDDKDR